jgi:hypothetical protein
MQTIFDILICIAGFFGGWILNAIWKAVQDLQTTDTKLSEKVSGIEVHLAGQYMKREEMLTMCDSLRETMDKGFTRIFDKLDGKKDK